MPVRMMIFQMKKRTLKNTSTPFTPLYIAFPRATDESEAPGEQPLGCAFVGKSVSLKPSAQPTGEGAGRA